MRITRFAVLLSLAITGSAALADAALAGSNDCGKGPPAWWNAPRVSYTYSNHYASGYSHSFSAQRRYVEPRRARVRYTSSRW